MTNQLTNIDLINFSGNAYGDTNSLRDYPVPDGYQNLNIDLNATEIVDGKEVKIYGNEGFKGAAYYNPTTNKLVVAYGGTDFDLAFFQDADDDSGFVTGATIDQAKYAKTFYENAIKKAESTGANLTKNDITLTGHSLGGGLAAMIGILKDVVATVFNAPNVGRQLDNIEKMDDVYQNEVFVSEGSITKNKLTSKDPSTFKVTNKWRFEACLAIKNKYKRQQVKYDKSYSTISQLFRKRGLYRLIIVKISRPISTIFS